MKALTLPKHWKISKAQPVQLSHSSSIFRRRTAKQARSFISLPPEIWAYIASLLPHEQLSKLYLLNSTFNKIAMDARYSEVSLPSGSHAAERLLYFSRSHIAPRVHTLKFAAECFFGDYDSGPSIIPRRMKQRLMNILARRREVRRRKEEKMAHLADLSFATVHYFSNVTSFHINGIGFELVPQLVRPFVKAAWSTFGANLEELAIVADLGSFTELLPTCTHLNHLRKFRLRIDLVTAVSDAWQSSNPGTEELLSFLQTVAPSLEVLDLTCFPWHGPNLPRILATIGHFPRLQSFSISTYDHSNPLSASFNIGAFIERHSSTLRHLEIPPHNIATPSSSTATSVQTGALRTLALTSQRSDHFQISNFRTAQFYVDKWRHTLTTLELNMHFLKHAEIYSLITCFQCQTGLKDMTLAVRALSPELFGLLARSVLGLERLSLLFYQICSDYTDERSLRDLRQIEHPPDFGEVTQSFLKEMGEQNFSHWKVQELNLHASWHILETVRGVSWKSLHSSILALERRTRGLIISKTV